MPRFFVKQEQIDEEKNVICLRGEDAHHAARSLRMAVGDRVTVCDMQGNEYDCDIVAFDEDREVRLTICQCKEATNEPLCRIRLFQALPKGDKLDTIIQKAVECGVLEVIPFESERCVVRMKPEAEARKTERRQRIAAEAAKQCGRSVIPRVYPTVSFSDMLDLASESELSLFCYEGEGTLPLGQVLREHKLTQAKKASVSVIIGSEGGFSSDEAKRAAGMGMRSVGLGKRILRTETASGFVLSCLVFVTELDGFSLESHSLEA